MQERLSKQIKFILEVDKLKSIVRQNFLADGTRLENDAEHSWHIALMIIVLSEHFSNDVDVLRVMKMLIIHDLVEIYAGDTYCYGDELESDKQEREKNAANLLFNLLPQNQADEFKNIWYEFELRQTPEAVFANIMDRIQPLLLNYTSEGKSWISHKVTAQKVLARNNIARDASPEIWNLIEEVVRDATQKKYLLEE